MTQRESREGPLKFLDNATLDKYRDQYDGMKDIRKFRVPFNESASKSAVRSGKFVVGETFIPSASLF